jgi:hypothetical protein
MIEPELKDLLQKNLESSQETLKVVKGMRSIQRWGSFFTVLKWIIIIGITFGSFYFIQPYLNGLIDTYTQLNETVNGVQKVGDSINSATASSTDLLKKLEGLLKGI